MRNERDEKGTERNDDKEIKKRKGGGECERECSFLGAYLYTNEFSLIGVINWCKCKLTSAIFKTSSRSNTIK